MANGIAAGEAYCRETKARPRFSNPRPSRAAVEAGGVAKRFWREALEDWRSVVLIVARKNGKTSMLAAFALYELVYGEGRPEILLSAASDRQAGRLFDAAARFVRGHLGLSERLRVRDHEG